MAWQDHFRIPPPEFSRKQIAARIALASDDPIVKQVIERLIVVAEIAHGEEIAEEFRRQQKALERWRRTSGDIFASGEWKVEE